MIYETCAVWEGEFFAHESLTFADALEWAMQYPQAKVRVWIKEYAG